MGAIIYKGTLQIVTVATAQAALANSSSKVVEEVTTGKVFVIAKNSTGAVKKVELT
jgi:hypothetical protein